METSKKLLSIIIETVSGKEHKFYFNGSVKDFDKSITQGPVPCCDKFGNPTTITKSFHPDNISVCTIEVIDAEIKQEEQDLPYIPIRMEGEDGNVFTMYVEK